MKKTKSKVETIRIKLSKKELDELVREKYPCVEGFKLDHIWNLGLDDKYDFVYEKHLT